jgi:cysteine synthase A
MGIRYKSVDLDSVEYQEGDRGGKIRAVLAAQTGAATIPQIFIGGEHVGGCTELFDRHGDGGMLRKLNEIGVAFDASVELDAYSLLPGWLHPRKTG